MIEIQKLKDWKAPKDWIEIQTIDVHTCGEPLRIIISGFPQLKGKTLLEKRAHAKNNFDQMVVWKDRRVTSVPIIEGIKGYRKVIKDDTLIETAKSLGIYLGSA